MKRIIKHYSLIIILVSLGCANPQKKQDEKYEKELLKEVAEEKNSVGNTDSLYIPKHSIYDFKDFEQVDLKDSIVADYDGDSFPDTARFIEKDHKSGIVIISKRGIDTIGAGIEFEEMGPDFSWVDTWGILRDSITFEVIVEDGELKDPVEFWLDHPSIFVQKDGIGGVITFKEDRYQWVHQAD